MEDKEDPKKFKNKMKNKTVCGYPLSIFFIVVNEFCERFSYYGMRAVLVLYFKNFLKWEEDLATNIYHVFVAFCYLTPIFGAIVADSWLGKFKTIIYLSVVYTIGQAALSVSAVHDITDTDRNGEPNNMIFHVVLSMLGLFLIALGTGGIKPCVAAFGGDQFNEHQDKQRKTFFSVFYLCINGGSLLSTIITPVIRAQECGIHSKQQCYSLAFGIPAALMVVALVVFIVGSGMYYKAEPKGNIMLDVCKCIWFAIKNRFNHRSDQFPKREHWMDWADEKYDKLLIGQIKMVLKVLFLYIPLPMFWTLFDQKGSRWTLQATTMDGHFGSIVIQPDQMQTVNPILILTMVPIMDNLIYPLIKKCGLNFTPLKRMTVGMFIASIAFVCAALVQMEIDKTLPVFPAKSEAQLKILNMGIDPIRVRLPGREPMKLAPSGSNDEYFTFKEENLAVAIENPQVVRTVLLRKGERQTLLIPPDVFDQWFLAEDLNDKPKEGKNAIRFVNAMNKPVTILTPKADFEVASALFYTNYTLVKNGKITYTLQSGSESCNYTTEYGFGSSYTYFIPSTFVFEPSCRLIIFENIQPNSVHMALQIPQYFFITTGEVMYSVTGLEFSYSQAPSNMKAVLQAGWLLTVAIGNIIVLIVAEIARLPKKWTEYILFACLLFAVCIIFSIMAYFYTYIDPVEIEAQLKRDKEEDENKRKPKDLEDDMKRRDSDDSHTEGKETRM